MFYSYSELSEEKAVFFTTCWKLEKVKKRRWYADWSSVRYPE
jgi:hypothetical protein